MFRADCGDPILSLIKKIELVTFLVFVLESFFNERAQDSAYFIDKEEKK
jgi:hypothetical protein